MIALTETEAIVTALHHIDCGAVWPADEIEKHKKLLKSQGFSWTVAESLPVHEEIKYRGPNHKKWIENYKQSLHHLGRAGISRVCYNFMPVIDWIRTDLHYPWKNHGISMIFDYPTFVAFDVHVLRRPHAEMSYSSAQLAKARLLFEAMSEEEKENLAYSIIVLTQGFIHGGVGKVSDYKKAFLEKLQWYQGIDEKSLRDNLAHFIGEVAPVAEAEGISLCLHPDDPPFPVLGLPRIAGTLADFDQIMALSSSPAHGITFCSGSLSSRADNDLLGFLAVHGKRVQFAHLRNTTLLGADGSFCESGHLEGGANMREIVKFFHREMERRRSLGLANWQIPMRPDHGLTLEKDLEIPAYPGYPYFGRMKGLNELIDLEER